MTWPKKDRIRWVEARLNERLSEQAGRNPTRNLDAEGVPDRLSLEVWLAKERDERSWQQIAIKLLSQYQKNKSAAMSKARRLFDSVERAISPSRKQHLKHSLPGRIQSLFGCTPEEFKRYLDSIPSRKRAK